MRIVGYWSIAVLETLKLLSIFIAIFVQYTALLIVDTPNLFLQGINEIHLTLAFNYFHNKMKQRGCLNEEIEAILQLIVIPLSFHT